MQHIFNFFFRLFLAFLAAKFLSHAFGLPSMKVLLGITALFLGNIYLFDYLDFRNRSSWRHQWFRRRTPPAAAPSPPEETPPES
jgi:hypothetical protein